MAMTTDICIIGGGAIGKAAALAMARAGRKTILLAAENKHRTSASRGDWDQRVYALNHVARDLLSRLRVWDAMDSSRIAAIDAIQVHGDGEAAGKIDFDSYSSRSEALAWTVEDGNINNALDHALQFATGVTIVRGSASTLRISDQLVSVLLEDGTQIDSTLLIGADGANSWVRSQADIGIHYRSYHQQAVVANFRCEKPHHGIASQWFLGEQGIVALLPLPASTVSLVWSAPDSLAKALMQESPEQLCRRLSELPGQTLGNFTPLPPATAQALPLRLIRSASMIAHRIALIGDAAHVVHPLAGQGMNLGFGDIDALLAALSTNAQTADCGEAQTLARYARHRAEQVMLMQLTTDGLQRLFDTPIAPIKFLRNMGLSAVDKLPFLKRKLMAHALGQSISS